MGERNPDHPGIQILKWENVLTCIPHTDFRKEMALLYTEHCFRFICLALKVGSMCSRQVSIRNAGIE